MSETRQSNLSTATRWLIPLISPFYVIFVIWMLIYGMPLSGILLLLVAAAVVFRQRRKGRSRGAARWIGPALCLLMVVFFWFVSLREYNVATNRLADRKEVHRANAFGLRENLAVYGINIIMGLGGYVVGFPEVASETLLMMFPDEDGLRRWESDFAMRSPKVRRAVAEMIKPLGEPSRANGPVDLGTRRISWRRYGDPAESDRVALALNCPLILTGVAHPERDGWRIDFVARGDVVYPETRARLEIPLEGPWGKKFLFLDEGIIWVLQENHWLHTYDAEYVWSIQSDDRRLEEISKPIFSLQERPIAFITRVANQAAGYAKR